MRYELTPLQREVPISVPELGTEATVSSVCISHPENGPSKYTVTGQAMSLAHPNRNVGFATEVTPEQAKQIIDQGTIKEDFQI